MKLVLVQDLNGLLGDVARIVARNSIIIYAGNENFEREIGKTIYVEVSPPIEPISFLVWRGLINNEMAKRARKFKFDYVVCIDWFGAQAGIGLAKHLDLPLISIFTSTEQMRGTSEISDLIISEEIELYKESDRVLTFRDDVKRFLGDKVEVMDLSKIGDVVENIDVELGISTN